MNLDATKAHRRSHHPYRVIARHAGNHPIRVTIR
jgi:hypothetical protein